MNYSGPRLSFHPRDVAHEKARKTARSCATPTLLSDKFGVCQWFHFEAHDDLEHCLELMAELGLTRLRTGISWADFHRDGGREWTDWQMERLRRAGLDVLLSVWHTPPSLAERPTPAAPPRRLRDYADFIDLLISEYGDCFDELELWNEPNNRYKWDFPAHDPDWRKFGEMVGMAAHWARRQGKTTVLGGMMPVDHHWLELLRSCGALGDIDVIAIHAFPGMWWPGHPNWDWHSHWHGWADKLDYIAGHAGGRPVWVTETGLATWDLARGCVGKHELQAYLLEEAAAAPAERLYWYSLVDLHPARAAIEGFHVDENEYHLGLVTHEGVKKPAYHRLKRLLARQAELSA
jgi:CDP-paratose 2-epimerase